MFYCFRGIAIASCLGLLVLGMQMSPALARVTERPQADRTARSRENFNAGWRFNLGAVEGAEQTDFDDRDWQSVGLPHSFSMPYFRSTAFYTGDGWYRKSFAIPSVSAGRRYSLEFEGAFQDAYVYVNGVEVAHHRGGYTGFPVDITDAVRAGNNVVAVKAITTGVRRWRRVPVSMFSAAVFIVMSGW